MIEPLEVIIKRSNYNYLRHTHDEASPTSARHTSIKLLKMRNPWGENSWFGKWSRFSDEWTRLSKQMAKKLNNAKTQTNGQFYMSFEDFIENFDELYIVHTNLNLYGFAEGSRVADSFTLEWSCFQFHGKWDVDNGTAGGKWINLINIIFVSCFVYIFK